MRVDMVTEHSKGIIKGILVGVCTALLVATLLHVGPWTLHWAHNDDQIGINTTHLEKIDQVIEDLRLDVASFHADHVALHEQVNQNHKDEMTAIESLRAQETKNAAIAGEAAARALLEMQRHSRLNIPSDPSTLARKQY